MDVDIITKLVSQLGFPIFVAVWLLWRFDGALRDISAQLQTLIEYLQANPRSPGPGA